MTKRFGIISLTFLLAQNIFCAAPNTVIGDVENFLPSPFNNIQFIALSPNGLKGYIPNYDGNTVSILNTTDNKITGTVTDTNATFNEPWALAFSPNQSKAYIGNGDNSANSTISIVNTLTDTVTGTVIVPGGEILGFDGIYAIAFTSTMALVVNYNGDRVTIVNTANDTVTGDVDAPLYSFNSPYDIVISPDETRAYVANYSDTNNIIIIDLTLPVPATIGQLTGVSYAWVVAITPDGKTLYAINYDGDDLPIITVIDIATNTIIATILGLSNPYDIVISPDGKTAYVADNGNNSVAIIDTATNTVTGFVNDAAFLFDSPYALAITPDGKTAYATNSGEDDEFVSIINLIGDDVISILPPASINAVATPNIFLTQTDLVNILTWTAPTSGNAPASYRIYRDAALTTLIATVPATAPLTYLDHNRQPNVSYTYYIVSVDAAGNVSSPISTTILG